MLSTLNLNGAHRVIPVQFLQLNNLMTDDFNQQTPSFFDLSSL